MRIILTFLFSLTTLFALQSMHPHTYETLEESNKLIELKSYKEAQTLLEEALKSTSKKRKYDLAFLEQNLAYLSIEQANFDEAIMHYEKALAYEILPVASLPSIYLILGQLYLQEEKTLKSEYYLSSYIKLKPLNALISKLFMGNALVAKDYDKAYKWCNKALSFQKKPNKELLETKKSLAIHLEKHEEALRTLALIMSHFEFQAEHFQELVYLYKNLDKDSKMLASLELAHQNNYLKSSDEIIQLALLYYLDKAPYKGVLLLDSLLDKDPQNKKILEIQAQLSMASRELDKAITNYEMLLSISKEPKTALSLARLYSHQQQWKKASQTVKPYIKKPEAKLLFAIALAQQKRYQEAKNFFLELKSDKKQKKEAISWLKHLKDKQ
jgi:predicted Zn-dependent protease